VGRSWSWSRVPALTGAASSPDPTDLFRIRVGDHRILYRVAHQAVAATVVRIAHRRDVYDHLDTL
jgi:mRNA interferase RelE/StbE